MAKYKVLLTVKDRYGNPKKVDGGLLDVGLEGLTEKDFTEIEDTLQLENYITKEEVKDFVADQKPPVYIPSMQQDKLVFDLKQEAAEERIELDIEHAIDWDMMVDQGSTEEPNYVWEPMQ